MPFYNEGLSMAFFEFEPKPNKSKLEPPIITITKNISKRKKKPRIVQVRYNANELNQVNPSSKKMKNELNEVKRKARNLFLSKK